MKLPVATCQFPESANIERNFGYVERLAREAKRRRARVAHFPETALAGYAGTHFTSWEGFDWDALRRATGQALGLARRLGLWLILGSTHRLSGEHLPHNSVYVISPRGKIVDRYDKLFCTGWDLKYYSPGEHFAVFDIEGVRCGVLICHDSRYPEVYREYYRRGARCIFQSFHNARFPGRTIHTSIMRPTLQGHTANNYQWLSVSNASERYQAWPSVFIAPDGLIIQSLRQHRSGLMLNAVDLAGPRPDKVKFRDLAAQGVLHSGTAVEDPRSRERHRY